jgi:hypothetical protein
MPAAYRQLEVPMAAGDEHPSAATARPAPR